MLSTFCNEKTVTIAFCCAARSSRNVNVLLIRYRIDDVGWDNYSINILKTVVVSPPYNLDNIAIKSGSEHTQQALSTLAHVQKIVSPRWNAQLLF